MANPNQSVKACIVKVDIKCCTSCQNKAKKKLQSISGVSAVDYNQEKGLMTVLGDVEPMSLVHKLTKCGKKAELVSVKYQLDDDDDDDLMSDEEEGDTASYISSSPDTKTLEEKNKKKSNKTKCFGLGCLWKKSKAKNYQPFRMQNSNWHVPSKFKNDPDFGFGFGSGFAPPYPQPMMQPQFPITGGPQQHNAYTYPPVNTSLHYKG